MGTARLSIENIIKLFYGFRKLEIKFVSLVIYDTMINNRVCDIYEQKLCRFCGKQNNLSSLIAQLVKELK